MQQCDNLAKRANELIAGTHLAEYIIDDISCEYSPSIGLFFVVDMNDREAPHNIRCSSFFELFNGIYRKDEQNTRSISKLFP